MAKRTRAIETLAAHGAPSPGDALQPPIDVSTAYRFADAADAAARFAGSGEGEIYQRWRNPTVDAFERGLATLEGAEAAVAFASGMGAMASVVGAFVSAGDHVVAPLAVYAESAKLLRGAFDRWGVSAAFVDVTDPGAVAAAIRPETRLVLTETPANPVLALTDIAAVAGVARAAGARLVVDSTFATPYHQRPLEHGADLVLHSATKALGGHGDVLGGVVAGSAALVAEVRDHGVRSFGAVLSPFAAFLLARGMKTLALRMAQASASAAELARRLEAHPGVARVSYPGLASHPHHALAQRQMTRGFGAMVAFELSGTAHGALQAGRRLYDRVELIARAVSLGDTHSLLTHPASTTHASMSVEQRGAAGIGDGLLRLAVGIEDVDDLWADLDAALAEV